MDDAKDRMLLKAFGDHLFVTRFEDMQRQRYGGEQNQRQRENGDQIRHPDIVPLTSDLFREYKTRR